MALLGCQAIRVAMSGAASYQRRDSVRLPTDSVGFVIETVGNAVETVRFALEKGPIETVRVP
jgi:hypothetical protein